MLQTWEHAGDGTRGPMVVCMCLCVCVCVHTKYIYIEGIAWVLWDAFCAVVWACECGVTGCTEAKKGC